MGRICRGLAPGQAAVIFQQDSLIGAAQQADSLCLCVHVLGGQQLHPSQRPHCGAECCRLHGLALHPHHSRAGRIGMHHALGVLVFLIDLQMDGQVFGQGLGLCAEHRLAIHIHTHQHILRERGPVGTGNGHPHGLRADADAHAAVTSHQPALGFQPTGHLDNGLFCLKV